MNFKSILRKYSIVVIFILLIIIGYLVYYYIENTSSTNNAFVVARIRPVSSQVEGYVSKIYVDNNEYVEKGAKLFSIQKEPYQYVVNQDKAQINAAEYDRKSLLAELEIDRADIKRQRILFDTAQFNAQNATALAATNAQPQATAENLVRIMKASKLAIQSAEHQAKATQHKLHAMSSKIKALKSMLKDAQYRLAQTTVYALTKGHISNLNLGVGTYVKAGEPLFSFVDTTQWWIQANLKETALTRVKKGQKVYIYLSMYPGHIFHGVVSYMGWASNRQKTSEVNFLPMVMKENQWFMLPQRFPVLIKIVDENKNYPLHLGASAYVDIIT